jgi:murein DD-endopeptidase MepM/ murein hydrolase activator NlpD
MGELHTFVFPTADFKNSIKSSKTSFLVDSSGYWHEGIHFSGTEEVKNICEAKVVAMRLTKSYENTYFYNILSEAFLNFFKRDALISPRFGNYFERQEDGYKLRDNLSDSEKEKAYELIEELFSNSFVLLKHSVKNNKNKEIEFYTLAQHLKPVGGMTTLQKMKLYWFDSTFMKKKSFYYYVDVSNVKIVSGNKRVTSPNKIPCETAVSYDKKDFNDKSKTVIEITWTQNGTVFSGKIKKEFIRDAYKEIRRPARNDKEGESSEYFKQDYNKKENNKIQIFTTSGYGSRQTKAVLNSGEAFKITEAEFINKYPLETKLKVEYKDDNKNVQYGYIYLNDVTEDDKTKWELLEKEITGKTEDTISFSDIEIKLKLKDGIRIDSVCFPKETDVPEDAGIGFAGYSVTKEADESRLDNEDATAVHYETFCSSVDFMDFKAVKDFTEPSKFIIHSSFNCLKKQPATKTEVKKDLSLSGCYYVEKVDTLKIIDNEEFVKIKILADASLSDSYILRSDLGEWNETYSVYTAKDKVCTAYSKKTDGTFGKIENENVSLSSSYKYAFAKQDGDYRKVKYTYTTRTDNTAFWVRSSVFGADFKPVGSGNEYLLEEKIPENEILNVYNALEVNEEVEITSGELTSGGKTLNCYNKGKVIQTWLKIKVDGTDYWTEDKNVSAEKNHKPVEQIPYNDWKRFFTEVKIKDIGEYKCEPTEGNIKKLGFTDAQYDTFNRNRHRSDEYTLSKLIKSDSGRTDFLFFRKQTEWIKNDKLTDDMCKGKQLKKKIQKLREKYVFWDEGKKLKSEGFPKSDTNWYFQPAAFIEHLDKVATLPEFNPYEGKTIIVPSSYVKTKNMNTGVMRNVGTPGITMTVKDNPGFAPLQENNEDQTEYVYKGFNFSNITGGFKEDYLDVERADGNTYREDNYSEFFHEGIDFHGNNEYDVIALVRGEVIGWGWFGAYGRTIFVGNASGIGVYLIAHLSGYNMDVLNKKRVLPFEKVGKVGGSGNGKSNVYRTHLHISYYHFNWRGINDIIFTNGDLLSKGNNYPLQKYLYNPFNHKENY